MDGRKKIKKLGERRNFPPGIFRLLSVCLLVCIRVAKLPGQTLPNSRLEIEGLTNVIYFRKIGFRGS